MRKRTTKIAALLVGATMVAGMMAGCGQAAAAPAAPAADAPAAEETAPAAEEAAPAAAEEAPAAEATGGEIEITFPCIWVGEDSKAEVFGKMVSDFNSENAGKYHVTIQDQVDYDAYQDQLRTQISTGNAPDIFTVKTQADVEYYASSGKCMDLTDFLAGDIKGNFVQGAIENAKLDGVNYAMPYEMAYIPIMYNQTEFDAAKATVPTSFDELWTACDALKASGVTPMCQMTANNAWTTMLWYSYALAATGGADVYSKPYTDQAYVDAAELILKMYQNDYTNSDAIGADASVVNGHFFTGDDAIYTNGTWILGRINSDEATYAGPNGETLFDSLTLGAGLSNGGSNGNGFISYCQAYIMCGAQDDAAKAEGVQAFLTYITDPGRVLELANSSGSLFAVSIDASQLSNEKSAEAFKLAQDAAFIIPSFESQAKTEVANAFPAALESLVLGDITAQEFAEELAAKDGQ